MRQLGIRQICREERYLVRLNTFLDRPVLARHGNFARHTVLTPFHVTRRHLPPTSHRHVTETEHKPGGCPRQTNLVTKIGANIYST